MLNGGDSTSEQTLHFGDVFEVVPSKENELIMDKHTCPTVPMEDIQSSNKFVNTKTILEEKSYKFNSYSHSPLSSLSSSSSSSSRSTSPLRLSSRLKRKIKKNAAVTATFDSKNGAQIDKMNCDLSLPELKHTFTSASDQLVCEEKSSRCKKKKKYDIWSSLLQVDTLMEDMRGINVTRNIDDRAVENYDYHSSRRLAREGDTKIKGFDFFSQHSDNDNDDLNSNNFLDELKACRKRIDRKRIHDNDNIREDDNKVRAIKLCRLSSEKQTNKQNSSKKLKQQRQKCYGEKNTNYAGENYSDRQKSGSDSESRRCRYIEDMSDVSNRTIADVALEMSSKLHEKNVDIMERIITVLGVDRSLKLYEETQRIESKGGMDIKSGTRRRTSGGIFMLLVRLHDDLTSEERKCIFKTESKFINTPNVETQVCNVKDEKKLTSNLTCQDQCLMEEGECSRESSKCQDECLPNPPPSPNYSFN